jgi:hypothetical protein
MLTAAFRPGTTACSCELCEQPVGEHAVRGRTKYGPWALMCVGCWSHVGTGIGPAHGRHFLVRQGVLTEQKESHAIRRNGILVIVGATHRAREPMAYEPHHESCCRSEGNPVCQCRCHTP